MTVENITDDYGNKRTLINMIGDGANEHHAIPHQNATVSTTKRSHITAEVAAELAGESVSWVNRMANRGLIECYGFNNECLFNVVDVEKLIVEMENEKERMI